MRRAPLSFLVLAASLAVCVATPVAAQPAPAGPPAAEVEQAHAACDRVAPAALSFTEDDAFERRLIAALRPRPETLTVGVARPFAPETTPDRVHAWLVEAARQGGAVRRREIPCGQAAARPGAPVAFGVRAFFTRPGAEVARAVRGYDATLWIEQATGAVTQVQFTRRAG